MKNAEISRQLQKLRDLVSSAIRASGGDVEMQSHWSRYMCVLSAGLIENAIKEIYIEFARRTSSPAVSSYVESTVQHLNNPSAEKILQLAGSFKSEWRRELEEFASENGRKEAVNSLLKQRHLIAHGKDSDITIVRLREYLARVVELLERIETQCQ